MSDLLERLTELVNDPEWIAESAKRIANDIKEKHEKYEAFYESDRFFEMLKWIKDNPKARCDNERIAYFPEEFPFTKDEFSLLWHCVDHKHEDERVPDDECSFPTGYIYYKEFEFGLMIGQGSRIWISVVRD